MANLQLRSGETAIIDDDDLELVNRTARTWYAYELPNGQTHVVGILPNQETIRLHHLVTGFQNAEHIDGDGLNNRKSNLEPSYHARLAMGKKKKRRNSTSQYKGVLWHKRTEKWKAQIWKNGKPIHLGYFTNEKEAAKAYDKAAKELFGRYANPNFRGD